jgi:hypothetical protein
MQQITIYSEEFELAAQQGVVVVRDRHQACGISRRSTILTGVALHGSHADKPFTKQVPFIALSTPNCGLADILQCIPS